MIIRAVFANCTEKIQAIKFLRALTGMGLRETKDLVDKIDRTYHQRNSLSYQNQHIETDITGEYRFRVDPVRALTGLLPNFNENGKAFPAGMNVYVEHIEIIDCTTKS